ncbi:ROK family transcriptional regulator [Nocardioides sp. BGMRC 2183]|nr:ROK family transcriptional regulator [Nocardioides sp. BGMRC 2183]
MSDPLGGPALPEQVRRRNTATVLRSLREDGPASRVELAARTGLARATVGTIVGALEETGVLRHHEQVRSGERGRPASRVTLAGSGPVGIGLEINVEHVAAVAVDLGGEVRLRRTRVVPSVAEASSTLVQIAREVATSLDEAGMWALGATVAVPGLIEADERTVAWTPNLPLAGAGVADAIDAVFGWQGRVRVSNDADCGALAELHHGAGRGSRHLLYLTGDVGIGAGVVADGRLMRGATGFAGEVGHLPLGAPERRCGCGRHGCWEASVGLHALMARVDVPGPGADLGTAMRTAVVVAERARSDHEVRAGIAELGRWLGRGLGVVSGVLDPGVVVLGGYFEPLGPLVLEPARAALAEVVASPAQPVPELRVGALGPEAAALGAAERAVADVLDGTTELDPGGEISRPSASVRP